MRIISKQHPLSQAYHHLLTISDTMLDLAQQAEWSALIQWEEKYLQQAEHLSALMSVASAPVELQNELRPLLHTILQNESEVRRLLQLRMEQVSQLLKDSRCQKKIINTYSQFSNGDFFPGNSL